MSQPDSSSNTKKLAVETDGQKAPARSPESPAPRHTGTPPSPAQPDKKRKRRRTILILAILLVGGAILGLIWWRYAATHEWTNNSYVTGRQYQLNSRIDDTVIEVLVRDNQVVRKGQLLVKLDPRDFQVQVQQAQANLESARRQASAALATIDVSSKSAQGNTTQAQGSISGAYAGIANAQAAVVAANAAATGSRSQLYQAEANLHRSKADYIRYSFLTQTGVTARQQLDSYRATYESDLASRKSALETVRQTKAQLAQAQKQVNTAESQLVNAKGGLQLANSSVQQTRVSQSQHQAAVATAKQQEANLKNAQLQLSYTNITSPTDGRVGNVETVVVGQRVQPGQSLIAIQEFNPWIVANFKETQLKWMRPGQFVEIRIDAFRNQRFWGRIDSIAPASGSTTALLPADNATGNFTKVVQRVPVKILFDPQSTRGYEFLIVPGMSTEVTVVRP